MRCPSCSKKIGMVKNTKFMIRHVLRKTTPCPHCNINIYKQMNPTWEYFKEKHRQLREEEIKTFHRLLGPEFAKGFDSRPDPMLFLPCPLLSGCKFPFFWLCHSFCFVVLTLKLCAANEAQRSLSPNERLVMFYSHLYITKASI